MRFSVDWRTRFALMLERYIDEQGSGSMGETLPDIRTEGEEKCHSNIYTISQPCSSGRSSPTNTSFRLRNLQPDSVSTNHVRPPSSEESLESNRSATRRNLTTMLSLIYAIFIVTLGCIFTSTYHGHLFSMKEYDEVYGIVMCVVGIAWLVVLHVDLTRYKLHILARIKKKLKEYEDLADRFSFTTECVINEQYPWAETTKDEPDDEEHHVLPHYRFLKGRHSGSFFLKTGMAVFCSGHIIHEGLMLSKHVIDWNRDPDNCRDIISILLHSLRPVYSFYQLFIIFKYSNVYGIVMCVVGIAWLVVLHVDLTRYKLHILARIKKKLKEYEDLADRFSFTTECVINEQYPWAETTKDEPDDEEHHVLPHYRFLKGRHSGSFFLKTGMAVFCSGHIIHEGLMLSKHVIDWNRDPDNCRDIISILLHSLRPVYSFYQLFIIFKYSNIVINRFKEVARFGVMHLIATSLHAWFSTIVDDAMSSHAHHFSEDHHDNSSNASQHTTADGCKGPYSPTFSSAAYLYPCTIEFSIILAGVWFIVWQNIGNVHLHSKSHHLEQKIDGPEGNHEITYESNVVISADCHAANKGLFSGILVLLTSIITVIIFFVVLQGSNFKTVGGTIYNCQEGILTALGLLASIVAYFKVIQLDQNAHPVTFLDNFLLFIPLPFFFIHAILCIMAELHLSDTFRIVLRVVALVQIIIQTPVLVDGLRRCSNSHVLRYRKPGREIITFLLILNVTQWVVFTVQQKHIDDLIAAKVVYGNLWSFIGHATIPLMLFYRFHSAVCLADIWQAAYHKGE
ncbi:proton channel OtopLc [Rhipicephalus sanguineus]|uniref:proton channel OtopLc n=1 Tax=Rhipicephalus sanguineus TaxID=34632 RepID=UPI0020C2BCAE|nr:proton channel OtopLc [Rhipicephalus sanguineus]